MAAVEIGPNDIIIHLVNPYRCGDCGAEFFMKLAFLDHIANHVASLKADRPCHQLVCSISGVEHAPKGITVTRDIVQINDQQYFELQDGSIDYSHLSPVKALEQAGILKLPPPPRLKAGKPTVVDGTGSDLAGLYRGDGGTSRSISRKQVSLLKKQAQQKASSLLAQQNVAAGKFKELTKELLGDGQLVAVTEGVDGEMQYAAADLSDPEVMNTFIQQAMLMAGQLVKDGGSEEVTFNIVPESKATISCNSLDSTARQHSNFDCDVQSVKIKEEGSQDLEKCILGGSKGKSVCKDSIMVGSGCLRGYERQDSSRPKRHMADKHSHHHIPRPITDLKSFPQGKVVKKRIRGHQRWFSKRCTKSQLALSGLQRYHPNRRCIRYGNCFHEVKVVDSCQDSGQPVQEHFLMHLLADEEGKEPSVPVQPCLEEEALENGKLDTYQNAGKDSEINTSLGGQYIEQSNENIINESNNKDQISSANVCGVVAISSNNQNVENKEIAPCINLSASSAVNQEISNHNVIPEPVISHEGNSNFSQLQPTEVYDSIKENAQTNELEKNFVESSPLAASGSVPTRLANSKDFFPASNTHEREPSPLLKCGHCKKLISSWPALSRHLIRHSNMKPFWCTQCSESFKSRSALRHHSRSHKKPPQAGALSKLHHPKLLASHTYCAGEELPTQDTRIAPLEDSPQFRCNVCQRVLKSRLNALKHLRIHDFQERAKALDAKDAISVTGPLSNNVEDHYKHRGPGLVGFKCLLCLKELRFKSFMVTHVRHHLNLKPFGCDHCPKSFFAKHELRKHQQNHTRPFKCPACGKGFIRRYMMAQHFRKRHDIPAGQEDPMADITELPDQKLIQCDICGKTMKQSNKSVMLYHIRLHKDLRPFQCRVCQKGFISENALKKHNQTHSKPYVCHVCGSAFSRRYLLKQHFEKKCAFKVGSFNNGDSNKSSESMPLTVDRNQTLMSGHERDTSELSFKTSSQVNRSEQLDLSASEANQNGAVGVKTQWQIYHADILKGLQQLKSDQKEFHCEPCNKTFTKYAPFLRHISTFSKPSACKYCKKMFEDKHIAIAHQRCCLGVDVAASSEKKTRQRSPSGWQERIKIMNEVDKTIESTHSTNLELSPPDTAPSLSGQESIAVGPVDDPHRPVEAVESKEGKYTCPQCDRVFSTPRGLKIHAAVHVRLFKCELCDVEFKTVVDLRKHSKSHTEPSNSTTTSSEDKMEEVEQEGNNSIVGLSEVNGQGNKQKNARIEETVLQNENGEYKVDHSKQKVQKENGGECLSQDCLTQKSCEQTLPIKSSDMENDKLEQPVVKKCRDESQLDCSDVATDDSIRKMKGASSPLLESALSDLKLMQSGTRGRPFRCQHCRKRFTQKSCLEAHVIKSH